MSDGRLELRFSDDGRGMATGGRRSAGGLCDLQDRARRANGDFQVTSDPSGLTARLSLATSRTL